MSIDSIIEQAKTEPLKAGTDLVIGLMSYDPSDPLRQGYSLGSALLSAQDLLGLTGTQMAVIAGKVVEPLVDAAHSLATELVASELSNVDARGDLFTLRMRLMTFGHGPRG